MALVLGFTLASLGWVPNDWNIAALTKKLLSYSIIGLGFGINFNAAIEASSHNLGLIDCRLDYFYADLGLYGDSRFKV